jgi:uncharacterized membrane-anchored protein
MKTWLLRIILVLQISGLVGLYAYHANIESNGRTYLLECHPADPRDLLSGDYVFLRYAISVPPETLSDAGKASGTVVYVLLRSAGNVWEISDVSPVPPTGDVPFLKGHTYGGQIDYGIERYYVPEGKGKNVPGDLLAEIVIQRDGTAQLKRLYSAGKPWPK